MQNSSPKQNSDEDSSFDFSESPTDKTAPERIQPHSSHQQLAFPVHPCYSCDIYLPDKNELVRSIYGEGIEVAAGD